MKQYALYHGDNFVDLGTIPYLAKKFNVKESTIKFYLSPAWRKRHKKEGIIVIPIEEGE